MFVQSVPGALTFSFVPKFPNAEFMTKGEVEDSRRAGGWPQKIK